MLLGSGCNIIKKKKTLLSMVDISCTKNTTSCKFIALTLMIIF